MLEFNTYNILTKIQVRQNARKEISMEERYEEAKKILEKYNQEHLLNNYEKLEEGQKAKLLDQIMNINFFQIANLYSFNLSADNLFLSM